MSRKWQMTGLAWLFLGLTFGTSGVWAQEAGQLKEQAQRLMRHAAELSEQGRSDEAARYLEEAQGLLRRASEGGSKEAGARKTKEEGDVRREGGEKEARREGGEKQVREGGEKRPEEIRKQVEMMSRKAAELSRLGRNEEASRVREEAQQLLKRGEGGQQKEGSKPQPEQARKQAEQMMRRAAELGEAGRTEEAGRLREEAQQLMKHAEYGSRKEGGESRDGRPTDGAMAEKMEHIRVAAEHLRAAGLNDVAEELMKQAERMKHGPR
ncbi:MAG: hypothetical protein KDA90_17340 [Planctomycetaceae bacterium]|nr:hypothetical protein [Planctomycetaceae bacterium]